jgi:Protein of unknown function (DUF2934)
MPRATRTTETITGKRRSRKAKPEHGNGTQVEPVTTSPEFAHESQSSAGLDEKIRMRAYQLYLQRGRNGGSPEQDWFQAQKEICGEQKSA